MITSSTPEQEALIPIIRDKWKKIALDTSPIDTQKSETAINNLYKASQRNTPEIIWFNNPLDAYLSISETYGTFYYPSYDLVTLNSPCEHIFDVVAKNLYETVKQKLHNNYCRNFTETIYQYISPVVQDYLLDEELLATIYSESNLSRLCNQTNT